MVDSPSLFLHFFEVILPYYQISVMLDSTFIAELNEILLNNQQLWTKAVHHSGFACAPLMSLYLHQNDYKAIIHLLKSCQNQRYFGRLRYLSLIERLNVTQFNQIMHCFRYSNYTDADKDAVDELIFSTFSHVTENKLTYWANLDSYQILRVLWRRSAVENNDTLSKLFEKQSNALMDECGNREARSHQRRGILFPTFRCVDTTYRVIRRLNQIEFAKRTQPYKRYLAAVPIKERDMTHPMTPDARLAKSKRLFDEMFMEWKNSWVSRWSDHTFAT